MTRIRVKGFKIFTDRHGKPRCYHRKSNTAIDLIAAPLGSDAFLAAVAAIAQKGEAVVAARPGTLGKLIEAYRASATFQDLQPLTRRDYQRHFDYLQPLAATPLARFSKPFIVRLRDKAAETRGRRQANYVRAVLSLLFSWGSERGYIATNPAAGIKDIRRQRGAPEPNRPWSDVERFAVLEAVPAHIRPALALMMFTGLGPKDALTLPRAFYRGGEIATKRAKTGVPVFWPAPAELRQILDEAPAHNAITLCANSEGRPWTDSGFRASWRPIRLRLQDEGRIGSGLTLYGLRHTVAVILREMGYDERAIADALGQETIEMARRYAKGADLRPKMRGMVLKFDVELNNRRTKIVKPD